MPAVTAFSGIPPFDFRGTDSHPELGWENGLLGLGHNEMKSQKLSLF